MKKNEISPQEALQKLKKESNLTEKEIGELEISIAQCPKASINYAQFLYWKSPEDFKGFPLGVPTIYLIGSVLDMINYSTYTTKPFPLGDEKIRKSAWARLYLFR